MDIAVIIPAAGASSRYQQAGGLRSKIDEDLGGRPVLHRTVDLFIKRDDVRTVIVAGPHDDYDQFIARHGDKLGLMGVRICKGGPTHRWQTVKAALALVPPDCAHIAVHDAARPCAPLELIDRCFAAAERHAAVIPAFDLPDTLKRIAETQGPAAGDPLDAILGPAARAPGRVVEATIPRDRLVLVQTPQVFAADLLRRAYEQPDLTSTDDAGLVERLGQPVHVVQGDPRNIKITLPVDLHHARLILQLKDSEGRAVHKRF
ncbi:MAG: 2-C-methyl-D-erythritol 4-phosphate cytidylyltransferase [Phycisphaerales bacterium]|nr:2-C-methyl-D-erythritol 4-phosphate cytidylyltransferase [Phycisphaerales bacterium]